MSNVEKKCPYVNYFCLFVKYVLKSTSFFGKILCNEEIHCLIELTAFFAASSKSFAVSIGKPESARIFFASVTFVP